MKAFAAACILTLIASPALAQYLPGAPSTDAVTPATITAPSSGTAPTGATQMPYGPIRVTTCSSTQPVQLPPGAASGQSSASMLLNRSGSTCTVYPPAAGQIEAGGANVAVTVAAGTDTVFRSMSPSAWWQ